MAWGLAIIAGLATAVLLLRRRPPPGPPAPPAAVTVSAAIAGLAAKMERGEPDAPAVIAHAAFLRAHFAPVTAALEVVAAALLDIAAARPNQRDIALGYARRLGLSTTAIIRVHALVDGVIPDPHLLLGPTPEADVIATLLAEGDPARLAAAGLPEALHSLAVRRAAILADARRHLTRTRC